MAPTLNPGDDILVDLDDCEERLRDGIYVLRVDDALVVKRLALNPRGRRLTIQSDNPAYPDWPDCALDEISCIGRVIWSGRKIVSSRPRRSASHSTTASRMPRPVPASTPFIGLLIARPTTAPPRMHKVRKHPPALGLERAMARTWQSRGG